MRAGAGGPAAALAIRALEGERRDEIVLELEHHGDAKIEVTVSNRYAGHLENGKASISDPGMGGLI